MSLSRFVAAELVAMVVLIMSIGAGVATRSATGTFAQVIHILPIIFAIAVSGLPIVFFAQPRRPLRAPYRSEE